jgi:hypothetical protein
MPNQKDPKQPKTPVRPEDTERDRPRPGEREPQRMPARPDRREIEPEVPGTEDDMRGQPGGMPRAPRGTR